MSHVSVSPEKRKRGTGWFAPVKCELQKGCKREQETRAPFVRPKIFRRPLPVPGTFICSLFLSLSLSPEPRTFNLRGNLAHVDLLAAVLCALQGYARASFDCVHPDSLRMLAFIGRLRLIRASRRGIVLRTTPTLS